MIKDPESKEETMIGITTEAAQMAKELLARDGKEGWGLRLYIYGGG